MIVGEREREREALIRLEEYKKRLVEDKKGKDGVGGMIAKN